MNHIYKYKANDCWITIREENGCYVTVAPETLSILILNKVQVFLIMKAVEEKLDSETIVKKYFKNDCTVLNSVNNFFAKANINKLI